MVRSVARGQFRVTWAADEPTFAPSSDDPGSVALAAPLPEVALAPWTKASLAEGPPMEILEDLLLADPEPTEEGGDDQPVGAEDGERTPPSESPPPPERKTEEPRSPEEEIPKDRPAEPPIPTVSISPRAPTSVAWRRGPHHPLRVVSIWPDLPPLGALEPDTEGPEEGAAPDAAPAPIALPADRGPAPLPPRAGEPEASTIALGPGPAGAQAPPAAPVTAEPGGSPTRTLVSLLARMWLMRSAEGTTGALTLPRPRAGPPSLPVPSSLEAPPAPPPPVSAPTLGAIPRPAVHLADVDDGRPKSGFAPFLVEIAALSHPEAVPPPEATSRTRVNVVVRLVHCPHPIPDRPVSRDSCHQPRVAR